jgi:hypothetical protein
MKQAWIWFKGHWQTVAGVIGSVVGFLFLRQYLQGDLKAKLENQKTQAKDDVLNSKKEAVQEDIAQEKHSNDALREKLDRPVSDLKPGEVVDFYKNRK